MPLTVQLVHYHLYILGLNLNATIQRAVSAQLGSRVFGKAQVTCKVLRIDYKTRMKSVRYLFAHFIAVFGRTDVESTINDFVFTSASKSAFENFTIVDDDVLEFDELFIAEFNFGPDILSEWNAMKGEPSTACILIRDDDCELSSTVP